MRRTTARNLIPKAIATSGLVIMLAGFVLTPRIAAAELPVAALGQEMPTLAPMIKGASPAVVNIAVRGSVEVQRHPFFDDPFFRRFFEQPGNPRAPDRRQFRSGGSGVIIDASKGYILTNAHVVENADEINVTLLDQRSFIAKVIGTDSGSDVAVIQVEAEGLVAMPTGDSGNLEVGDYVVAIGNPFGLQHTVTAGIVSALGRSGLNREGYQDFIQTDAPINPGNSGGALVNLRGELVGINSQILSTGGGNVGIGFAIPINMAQSVMAQLLEFGEVKRGILGVNIQDVNSDMAAAMGLDEVRGAIVSNVVEDSAAERAGVKEGDVIDTIEGEAVRDASDLRNKIGLRRVGEKIRIGVIRDGKRRNLSAVIGAAPGEDASADSDESEEADEPQTLHPQLEGARFGDLTEASPMFGKVNGVVVLDILPGSPAARTGLLPGDVVTSVKRRSRPREMIKTLRDFAEAVDSSEPMVLKVQRDGGGLFVPLR